MQLDIQYMDPVGYKITIKYSKFKFNKTYRVLRWLIIIGGGLLAILVLVLLGYFGRAHCFQARPVDDW